MDGIFKICGIAIISLCITSIVGSVNRNMVFAVRIGGAVLVFGFLLTMLSAHTENVRKFFGEFLSGEFAKEVEIMVKALGISSITKICSDICRDAGESGLANGVETVGKLSLVGLALPLVSGIAEYLSEMLKAAT